MAVLHDLQRVLRRVLAHAHRCGMEPGSKLPFDSMVGHTMADVGVADLVLNEGDALLALLKRVDESIHLLELSPAQFMQHSFSAPDSPLRRVTEILASMPLSPIYWESTRRLPTNANRRLREVQIRSISSPDSVSIVGPGLVGAPPRSLDGTSWVRAFLVELLDVYAVRPAAASEGMVAPTDSDIALVSLLSGALDEMYQRRQKSIGQSGVAAVLAAERRAIALARRRRGPVSKALHERGMTVRELLRLKGWTEERPKGAAGRRLRDNAKETGAKRKK
jgi:hypothetical protein